MIECSSNSPLVSVIVIALREEECEEIELHLSRQRFRDFELVIETGGSIPNAWNRAVRRARGEILVFTETDARPLSEYWLDELVGQMVSADHRLVVKGLEVVGTPWNLCNLAIRREAFREVAFDESFRWAEDSDLFSRLSALSYRLERRETAAVFHQFNPFTPKALWRAFSYGVNWMRIRHRYAHPLERATFPNLFLQMTIPLLEMLGMIVGALVHLPERRLRKIPQTTTPPCFPKENAATADRP